jgi:hypothetical protein
MLIRLRDVSQRRLEIHQQQFGLHAALRIFLPILFPIRQRRHGNFRVFRIRPMHRLGVVSQRLLREPFRETAFQRPLRPRIPVAIQRFDYCDVHGGDVAGEGVAWMRKKPLSAPGKSTLADQMVFVSTPVTGMSCQVSLGRFDRDWTE